MLLHGKFVASKLISIFLHLFIKNYRQDLADFRTSSLPRQFSNSFQERMPPDIIRRGLTDIKNRFDKVKSRTTKHDKKLQDLVNKHRRYSDCGDSLIGWLGPAEAKLEELRNKPIGGNADSVRAEIDRVQVG